MNIPDDLRVIAALVARLQLEGVPVPFTLTSREVASAPPIRLAWNQTTTRLTIDQDKPFNPADLKWGERVVCSCTATGLYLGEFDGHHLALFVSAMDNSINIDTVQPEPTSMPSPDLPVPTARELEAATTGLSRGGAKKTWTGRPST